MDETFHLTPLDVRRYDFGRTLRGYDPERVEQFRQQVAEELERLTRQTQELEAKAKGFHEQLRAFPSATRRSTTRSSAPSSFAARSANSRSARRS